MYKTTITSWVPVSLAERLNEIAFDQHTTRCHLIGDVLSRYVYGSPLGPAVRSAANRDGKADPAEAIIRANHTASIPALMKLMENAGCKHGKNWVSEHRRKLLAKGSTNTEG